MIDKIGVFQYNKRQLGGMVIFMETPVHAPFNVKVRLEIAKLRKMSLKDKLEYIWEYYKLLLFGIVAALLIIGNLVNSFIINPQPQIALFIEWSAGFASYEQLDSLSEVLAEHLVDESENEVVTSILFVDSPDNPHVQVAMVSRRMAMVGAGELDVAVQNEGQLRETAQLGMVKPMDTILAEIRLRYPMIYGKLGESLVYAVYDPLEDGGEERIMGVDITGNHLLEELGFRDSELIFSVFTTSGRLDNIVDTLVFLNQPAFPAD
jgi:hypothetical protein